jgi:acetyl esterase/lipase
VGAKVALANLCEEVPGMTALWTGWAGSPDEQPQSVSRAARVLEVACRSVFRPSMALLPANRFGVRAARSVVRLVLPMVSPVGAARVRQVRTRWKDRPLLGEWVHGGSRLRPDSVLLYLHGSGYICCSPRTHRGLVGRLSEMTGLPAFVVRYRLAPKYPFPAAADDAMAAYQWLLASGYPPERIVVAGDSAGGHLALGLAVALRRAGLPLPAAMALFSPLVDTTFETAARRDAIRHDPLFTLALAKRMVQLYGGRDATDDPRLTPLTGDLSGLPPLLLQAGGAEMLTADSEAIAELVDAAGGTVRLQIWPGQVHVFQALHRLLPEAQAALDETAAFIGDALAAHSAEEPEEYPGTADCAA